MILALFLGWIIAVLFLGIFVSTGSMFLNSKMLWATKSTETYPTSSDLLFSHGNAIPERGFSMNNVLLTKDRMSLKEESIISEWIVKDAIRLFGFVTAVPISKGLIRATKKAYSEYAHHLEEEKKSICKMKNKMKLNDRGLSRGVMILLSCKSS